MRILIFLSILFFGIVPAFAHKVSSAFIELKLDTEKERTFSVTTHIEVESSGDAALDDEIGPEEAAKIFVTNELVVLIDEKEQPREMSIKLVHETDDETPEELRRYSVQVICEGRLPDTGKELTLFLKETSPMQTVVMVTKNGIPARRLQVMFAGEHCRSENIEPLVQGNPFESANQAPANAVVEKSPVPQTDKPNFIGHLKTGMSAALHQTALPLCLLLAFMILSGSNFRSLMTALICFLVAHSVGISLSATGFIPKFPGAIFLCAGSLLALAIDNLFSSKFQWWRYLAGACGGFFLGNDMTQNGAFLSLGTPLSINSFLPFQIGFDLSLLGGALILGAIMARFGQLEKFRSLIVIPISLLSAGIGIFLILQGSPAIEALLK